MVSQPPNHYHWMFFHWLTIDINGFFNGFPQVLVRARIWCELKKGVFFGNFSQIQKLSRLPGNLPDCPETFQTARKLSRKFPDCPKTFQTVRKLSKLSGNFPDCPETFQTVRTLSRLSGNFPDCPETFQTIWKLSRQLTWFKGQFCIYAQKLSGRAKTFRDAMHPRILGFSASAQTMVLSIQSVSWPKRDGSYSFLRHLGPFGCITTAIKSI